MLTSRLIRSLTFSLCFVCAYAHSAESVYNNSLTSDWQNWSWGSQVDFAQTTPTHGGNRSIKATYNEAWSAVYLRHSSNIDTSALGALRFAIHGGTTGGHSLKVLVVDGNDTWLTPVDLTTVANQWTVFTIALSDLDNPGAIKGIVFQDTSGASQTPFYLDSITLTDGSTTPATPGQHTIDIDLTSTRHSISPYIYGMSFTLEPLARELKLPFNRWGGNAVTRYNYKNNVSNRASDWYFENIPDPDPGTLPTGSSADLFVGQNKRTGTDSLITIPMLGWTPKGRQQDCGFSQSKYGAQDDQDPYNTDCGNGISNGVPITGNDPTDTSRVIGPSFVTGWINHLKSRFSRASAGGVQFYALDNEPMLWNETHRDVRPTPLGYDELRQRTIAYAKVIKAADPDAKTFGPALWGWTAYFWSAVDVASGDFSSPPDRGAHGNTALVPWYLQQMAAYEESQGVRLLDYLDLHYYPQANGVALAPAGGRSTQLQRLRATRSLWDSSYQDESWINEPVMLIPRAKAWIDEHYPGTGFAINEYNFGGFEHINGAVTQADVLGIFGEQDLDAAAIWTAPATDQPVAFAFRMFRNYDGSGSQFGNVSLTTNSDDRSAVSVFAARRTSDNKITAIVINKTFAAVDATIRLQGASGGNAEVYQYSASDLSRIRQLASVSVSNGQIKPRLPAQSITLFELPDATNSGSDSIDLSLNSTDANEYGHRYGSNQHKKTLKATFTGNNTDLMLSVWAFDIDRNDEVAVYLNDQLLRNLRRGTNNTLNKGDVILLPVAMQQSGNNELRFEQKYNNWKWGVTNLHLSPYEPGEVSLSSTADTGQYGNKYGSDLHHFYINATFESNGQAREFSVRGYDIDRDDEVAVYLNDQLLGHLKTGRNNRLAASTQFTLPANAQRTGSNTLQVRQTYDRWIWGVTGLSLTP